MYKSSAIRVGRKPVFSRTQQLKFVAKDKTFRALSRVYPMQIAPTSYLISDQTHRCHTHLKFPLSAIENSTSYLALVIATAINIKVPCTTSIIECKRGRDYTDLFQRDINTGSEHWT
jgi:hypothetical protein